VHRSYFIKNKPAELSEKKAQAAPRRLRYSHIRNNLQINLAYRAKELKMVEKEKHWRSPLVKSKNSSAKGAIMKLGDAAARAPVATISTAACRSTMPWALAVFRAAGSLKIFRAGILP
jgi:hypothetical protein